MNDPNQPLNGIRVLDLTRLYPGALCTLIMADLGAEVIKVEQPGGDYWRQMSPASFEVLNRNKRGVVLDFKNEADVEQLLAILPKVDVVLNSFRPGVLDRLGLSAERMQEINPCLIIGSLNGYGATGERKYEAGHDLNYMGYAGMLNGLSTPPSAQTADALGAFSMANAIMAALFRRERTGQGAVIDIGLLDGALISGIMVRADAIARGHTATFQREMLSGGLACYHIYQTADGKQMALGALEFKFFQGFCEAVARPDLLPAQFIPDKQPWLYDELTALFQSKTRDEWVALLAETGADVCCTPILDLIEAAEDPGVQARELLVTDASDHAYTRSPVRLVDVPQPPLSPAPAIGADNDELRG